LLTILSNQKLDFVVVGGYAVATYRKRFSVDLDLVIKEENLQEFESICKKEGYNACYDKDINLLYGEKFKRYYDDFKEGKIGRGKKQCKLLSYHPHGLDLVLAHVLANNNSLSFEEAKTFVEKKSLKEKMAMIQRLVAKRNSFDEWVDAAFQMVNVNVEFTSDIGAVRDLRRHQKNQRCEALYTLDMGHSMPPDVVLMGPEAVQRFNETMENVHAAEKRIRTIFPYQVQYILPMACLTTLRMNMDLDQIQYMIYTRSTPEGHESYRWDVFHLCEAICRVYPWLLGYETYPEGKDILTVYNEAPLKDIIRMRTDQTGLHQ